MKIKTVTLALASLLISTFCFAQGGIRGGIGHSSFSKTDRSQYDQRNLNLGLYVGGVAVLVDDGILGLELGVNYAMRGANFNGLLGDDRVRYTLGYIDVPLLVKLQAGPLSFRGGGYAGYALHGGWKATVLGIDADGDFDFDGSTGWRRFDYGYVAGVGLDLSEAVTLEGRMVGGLAEITAENNPLDAKNYNLQLGLIVDL